MIKRNKRLETVARVSLEHELSFAPLSSEQHKECAARHIVIHEAIRAFDEQRIQALPLWAMVAAAIAVSPSAGESLWNAFYESPPIPITPIHLIEIVVLGVTIALAIAFGILGSSRRGSVVALDICRNCGALAGPAESK
jgi:hypothetical protein